ncbi:hypothetical protein [Pseudescherichia vulneris]|uniref:hypothetical protein n=1 Tax=Pseudescherichia vulneris TaxID=566 RepID=UPI0028D43CC4|nr:hypothetical protein [Pseudescherichia vulneris]
MKITKKRIEEAAKRLKYHNPVWGDVAVHAVDDLRPLNVDVRENELFFFRGNRIYFKNDVEINDDDIVFELLHSMEKYFDDVPLELMADNGQVESQEYFEKRKRIYFVTLNRLEENRKKFPPRDPRFFKE